MTIEKKKRTMGRPPAKWVYELAKIDLDDDGFIEYSDICERFGISLRAIRKFCAQTEVEGEYFLYEKRGVRKRFRVKRLREAAKGYLKGYFKERV